MYGTRVQRRLTFMFLPSPAAALFAWGMVGGSPLPETSASVASTDSTMSARALLAASEVRTADGLHWCDEALGCNDAR